MSMYKTNQTEQQDNPSKALTGTGQPEEASEPKKRTPRKKKAIEEE